MMLEEDYFDIKLNKNQSKAFTRICSFVEDEKENVFILKGYAGTGKSTIVKGILKWLSENKIPFQLLGSTGRASKVISDKTKHNASTVHSAIYVFKNLSEDLDKLSKNDLDKKGQISLQFGLKQLEENSEKTVYIIDEASMIGNKKQSSSSFANFGSGQLLNDLFNYDPAGKFIFIGDASQLPPVSETLSPALSASHISEKFNLNVQEYELTEIMRQEFEGGIIKSSMHLRKLHENNTIVPWPPKLKIKGSTDIILKNNHLTLINDYIDQIKSEGFENSTLICQSNRHRDEINRIIRKELIKDSNELAVGDLLMVTQNNLLTGLVNGDQVIVLEKGERRTHVGINFIKVRVQEMHSKDIFSVLLIEDVIYSSKTNIDSFQHKKLLIDFHYRMKQKNTKQSDDKFKEEMKNDPYLNGLKAVYGYAITCHKSQGGEWENVYLYLDNKILGLKQPGIYQWWYTAITRAKKRLHIVDDWFLK